MATKTSPTALSNEELQRYARHLVLPNVGPEGQQRLKAAKVLLVGLGGLGSPAGLYLAAAGVGTLGLVDFDAVEASNLQRQVIHGTKDVGRAKIDSAMDRLHDVNPHVRLTAHRARLTSSNALDIVKHYDLVVDGSDNFPTRYLVNDACGLLGKPNVYGSIYRFEGQVSVFWAARGPCYRCLFRDPPPPEMVPSCAEGGVLGVLPGIIGSLQAIEAIKLILGSGDPLIGRLLVVDTLAMKFRELALSKDPDCPLCGTHPTVRTLIDYEAFCGAPPAKAARRETNSMEVTATALRDEMAAGAKVVLLDVREAWEVDVCSIPGSRHVALSELPERLAELDKGADIVALCHKGSRSIQAARFLAASGFGRVRSLAGGVDAWAREVEPSMARY